VCFKWHCHWLRLCRVCSGWRKYEYGALVEWYQQGKTKILKRNTCPSATLSTKNPTQTGLESNPGFYGDWPATNFLNHSRTYENDINCVYTSRKVSGTHNSHCFVPCGSYKINAKLPIKHVEDNSNPQYWHLHIL
jgi:hypothetical protein